MTSKFRSPGTNSTCRTGERKEEEREEKEDREREESKGEERKGEERKGVRGRGVRRTCRQIRPQNFTGSSRDSLYISCICFPNIFGNFFSSPGICPFPYSGTRPPPSPEGGTRQTSSSLHALKSHFIISPKLLNCRAVFQEWSSEITGVFSVTDVKV